MKALLAVTVLALAAIIAGQTAWRQVPVCEEDAVLIGTGDFDGRYTQYVCGPALDDFGA